MAASAEDGIGTPGKQRRPWLVATLTIATLGLYGLYWQLAVAKEAERFDPASSSLRWPARIGSLLLAVPLVVLFGSLLLAAVSASAGLSLVPQLIWDALPAGMLVAFVIGLVGLGLLLLANWRLWKLIRHHELALQVPDPLDPREMLRLALTPGINLLMTHRIQGELNRIWSAAHDGYAPA